METDLAHYVQIYPQYRSSLETLQTLLNFQAGQVQPIEPSAPAPSTATHARWEAGLPLLNGEALAPSRRQLREALEALRPVLADHELAQTALDRLLASADLAAGPAAGPAASLFDNLNHPGARPHEVAAATAIDPDMLALLLRAAVTPFYEQQAVPHRPWIATLSWRHGICPVCGSEPSLARLAREDGRRILVCSMCRSEWAFDRLRCAFCESGSLPRLRHFTVEGDPAHRVDCCVQCGRYLKTVDERLVDYRIYLPAEELVTAHLDTLARAQGYQ